MSLSLPPSRSLNNADGRARRSAAIEEAISWPRPSSGTIDRVLYDVDSRFQVGVRMPGKEADESRTYVNRYDMLPLIWRDGAPKPFDSGFNDICRSLFDVGSSAQMTRSEGPARVFGALLYRASWALDHRRVGSSMRFVPPDGSLSRVVTLPWVRVQTPSAEHDFPVSVFLFFLEVLALNEDIKYFARRRTISATGRPNTLQTCARALACGLGSEHPMDFSYALMRGRGVATLTRERAIGYFPELI
jgi:hypothetical protein